ncbi:MAG: VWA domain-containing protein [Planctomycetota bacterium]
MELLANIFGNLKALFFLFLFPIFWALFYYGKYRKQQALSQFASPHLLRSLMDSVDENKRQQKRNLFTIALFFLILTLLRPQWGYTWVQVQHKGIDIMVVLDVSKSMLADDIKPNRLERAKREIKDLVHILSQQGGDRLGLVIFAGRAFVQCPLTFDYGVFNLFLDQISTESIQKGGTGISNALHIAQDAFKSKLRQHKAIILITDGEENQIPVDESTPEKAQEQIRNHLKATAQYLREEGIRLFTVGIGSPEKGSYITLMKKQRSGQVEESILKDRKGNWVRSKMDKVALQMMALETNGVFFGTTGGGFLLEDLYEKHISQMQEKELSEDRVKRKEERFQFPLMIAILLLFIEPLLTERKRAILIREQQKE